MHTNPLNAPFSTERKCKVCKAKVHWTKFYLEKNICKPCWREHIKREVPLAPNSRGKQPKPNAKSDKPDDSEAIARILATIMQADG